MPEDFQVEGIVLPVTERREGSDSTDTDESSDDAETPGVAANTQQYNVQRMASRRSPPSAAYSEWTRDFDFGPPPRKLSTSLFLRMLCTNNAACCGWLILMPLFCISMLFMSLEGLENAGRLMLLASSNTALANATDIVRTPLNVSMGDVEVCSYSYLFNTQGGKSVQGECFGECTRSPSKLTTYSTFEPSASVLAGMRPLLSPMSNLVFYMCFQSIGLLVVCMGLVRGRALARMFSSCVVTGAALTKYSTEVITLPNGEESHKKAYCREYRLTFEIKTTNGTVHEVERTHRTAMVPDVPTPDIASATSGYERVMYDPDNPQLYIFMEECFLVTPGRVMRDGSLECRFSLHVCLLEAFMVVVVVLDFIVGVTILSYIVFYYLRGLNLPRVGHY
mmetsp:Transcript_55333/g.129550  ORF Transcript_55333/g.129550 Transcript_55333/m.129550 type:complete len:393 (-) Transcript_55333:56-1234(-)